MDGVDPPDRSKLEFHVPDPEPRYLLLTDSPRRGCVSVIPWLVLVLLWWMG